MAEAELGGYTKAAVKRLFSSYLRSRAPGERVDDPEISELLSKLVLRHPEAAEKIGPGIEFWVVCSNRDIGYASKGFRLKQVNHDELVRFSYLDALKMPSRKDLVAEALTLEALEITREFRTEAFRNGPVCCAKTGVVITKKTDADVVHWRPRRQELHLSFLMSEDLNYEAVELVKHPTESGMRLKDRALAERWCDYQREHLGGLVIELAPRSKQS